MNAPETTTERGVTVTLASMLRTLEMINGETEDILDKLADELCGAVQVVKPPDDQPSAKDMMTAFAHQIESSDRIRAKLINLSNRIIDR